MDLKQLRQFVAVAEERHFGRAAERLGMAQPAVTLAIQKLERELGCELLFRDRQTTATAAGRRLLTDARALLAQAEAAIEATRHVARGDWGSLRLAVPPSVMLTGLPTIIRTYRRTNPNVVFTLREMGTSAIEKALLDRDIDLGFLRETTVQKPLKSGLYRTEALVAVLPAGHRLAEPGVTGLRLQALAEEPFVFFPRHVGPQFYDLLLRACSEAGFVPKIVQEATQWSSVISLVEAGMGVSIAPACVEKLGSTGVAFRKLAKYETKIHAAWHAKSPPTATTFASRAMSAK
jgi:DNA-binding transcriptional LysR family regulator